MYIATIWWMSSELMKDFGFSNFVRRFLVFAEFLYSLPFIVFELLTFDLVLTIVAISKGYGIREYWSNQMCI